MFGILLRKGCDKEFKIKAKSPWNTMLYIPFSLAEQGSARAASTRSTMIGRRATSLVGHHAFRIGMESIVG